jgi:DNA-binding response OmpR family regulator
MPKYLVVADAAWARNEVHAAVTDPDVSLIDHADPATAADTAVENDVDLVIADLQMKAMGGMAVTRSLREATGSNEGVGIPVVLLLDRTADAFLAKRAGAASWVVKPFTAHQLGQALATALGVDAEGESEPEDGAEVDDAGDSADTGSSADTGESAEEPAADDDSGDEGG